MRTSPHSCSAFCPAKNYERHILVMIGFTVRYLQRCASCHLKSGLVASALRGVGNRACWLGSSNKTSCRRDATPGTPESTVKIDKLFKFDRVSGMQLSGLFWIQSSVREVNGPRADGRLFMEL